jgi:uncharacterized protein (DUF1501 family)
MKRREFLKTAACSAVSMGLFGHAGPRSAFAAVTPQRTLVNTMLVGGADMRYLFVPSPGSAYADTFWNARQSIYNGDGAPTYTTYDQAWADLYLPTDSGTGIFGIHKNAAWLKQQFDLGNAAIIANVRGSTNRRHDHSQLIMHAGDPGAGQFELDRAGWGGRLVEAMGNSRSVAVSKDISVFVKGTDAANRNAQVVHARDTRNFALSSGDGVPDSVDSAMARALKNYYTRRRVESVNKPVDWPYWKFLQHEQAVRNFGTALDARLQALAPQQPTSLQALYSGAGSLSRASFGQQLASLYDSFLAADLFQMRVAYLDYASWDSHKSQRALVDPQWHDLFGTGRGLDTLNAELAALPGVLDNTVFVFTTDFGRQLNANGDFGTDHGRGNYMVLVGKPVRGGVYGDMFPDSEIPLYADHHADIEGLTDFQLVMAEMCEWMQPGSGPVVLPNTAPGGVALPVENGVQLNTLFS